MFNVSCPQPHNRDSHNHGQTRIVYHSRLTITKLCGELVKLGPTQHVHEALSAHLFQASLLVLGGLALLRYTRDLLIA